ncbi:collagen alpha-5(VI) chain-like [Mya arenaria]|uniref:collagen alpha-5(VI) chain-like n=1 Tax=Mya arenaria TaxID=6604 RepID=UPI0022E57628|nr:collagen alpha-5(VI) chain-like [Mya arenaria]
MCAGGWKGDNCETIDCSYPGHCSNNGTCKPNTYLTDFRCDCPYGGAGKQCQNTDVCSPFKEADVVFLLDTSASENSTNVFRQKSFMLKMITNVTNSTTNLSNHQFSLVTFASRPKTIFYLNTYHNQQLMVDAIENVSTAMTFGGSTYLERALDLVQSEIFTKRHGARDGVGRYVFILSDGLWSRPVDVMAKANFLKSKAQIYGIATGSQIKHSQLLDISTFDNVYPIGSPDVVHMIAKEIVFGCKGCSRRGTDVLLAFDLLWDNAYKEFETALDAGKLIINGLSLYPNGSDVSITTYGNDFKTIVSFNENKPKQALMQILNSKIKQEKTVSAMDESAFINNIETSFRSIVRPRRKFFILFTQGSTMNTCLGLFQRFAKKFDVTVVTIGVGWRTNIKNLLEISSDPAYTYVLGDEMGADETVLYSLFSSLEYDQCPL